MGLPESCVTRTLVRLEKLVGENTLAYHRPIRKHTAVKCFIILTPGANALKHFMAASYKFL
jgi:hypothetical protein